MIYDTKQGGIIEDKDRIIKIDPDIEITPKSIEKHGITMERSQASEYSMKDVLNLDRPPEVEKTCEKCAYLKGGKDFFNFQA